MDKKGPYIIQELREKSQGTQIWGKYLILEKVQRKTKDGKNMFNLKIGDSSGEINVVVWENCAISGALEVGAVIGLLGDVGVYANRVQVTARKMKVLTDEDPLEYLKAPNISIDDLVYKLNTMIDSIKDDHITNLIKRIFTTELTEEFIKAPAAKKIHHNYSGGLLEHTVTVCELCLKTCETYPMLNRDLLIAGAILHDIGKIDEYNIKVVPEYTVEGRLIGHIVLGNELITKTINEMRAEGIEFPQKLEWMIKHMILSHHGVLEYGSPVVPLFPEAFLLHMMDNLDAKMFVFDEKITTSEGEDEFFTPYDSFFEQLFFKYRY
ncbi:3'-5' exoribonuclease YhaM family protein [Candidatus Syntrophocurvum alkaliphilum]|uniref:3'-5' exoribonuclease YhaM family protein n=1 Tax=Candidatus Syntrophocurvum alkaliphilum TaxID=2293317 RepID=UPI0012E1F7F1|nr:3'-5' exoribonuclease YhaM family protein [Candidatus Syntrophocurvum alkaliphilum]